MAVVSDCYDAAAVAPADDNKGAGELRDIPGDVIVQLRAKLLDNGLSLPARYRALYSLRNAKGEQASSALRDALDLDAVPSALLRHDVAFCLGQRQDPAAIAALVALLGKEAEHPMVRHEAGEALGAICTEECLEPLRRHDQDACREVAETCQLALQRVEYFKACAGDESKAQGGDGADGASPFVSVDPTPAAPASTPLEELRHTVLDEDARMFDRYRALFALRNKGGAEAAEVLTEIFRSGSALLKHEVAYVLGQMLDKSTTEALVQVLKDPSQAAMVRHEAAEALGAIAEPWTTELLREFSADAEPIVAESCIVALDMLEHEESGAFEYADTSS